MKVGIIGIKGSYGKWLKKFFESLGNEVVGSDIDTDFSNEDVAKNSDVVIFSVPIDVTVKVIHSVLPYSRKDQLWMDVTSLKKDPVEAMMKSKAEVVGLHPMCGVPSSLDFKGQILLYCPARLKKWKSFVEDFLNSTKAEVKKISPDVHDKEMAIVQALPHAVILTMAMLIRHENVDVKKTLSSASPFYRIVFSLMGRILAQNPHLYADIQLNTPHVISLLDSLEKEIGTFKKIIKSGNKQKFLEEFNLSEKHFGKSSVDEAYTLFERLIRRVSS
jgi:prephenate dehydrogenase